MSTIIPLAIEPTNFPTGDRRTIAVDTSSIEIPFAVQMRMREKNALCVETECNVYSLPRGARIEPSHDAVRIFATDVETLGHWLEERGGTVTVTQAGDGVQVWTLHTETLPELPKYPAVTVLVSVLVTDDEQMMPELRAAVVTA